MPKAKNKSYFRIGVSPILEELLLNDAVVRTKSITAIIEDIIEAHYTNGNDIHKKLNFIIKHIEAVTGAKSGIDIDPKSLFDIPVIPLEELLATRKNKRRYKQTLSDKKPEKKVDIRDVSSFLAK